MLCRVLTSIARNWFGSADIDGAIGDGGGEGVELADRKVGPGISPGIYASFIRSYSTEVLVSRGWIVVEAGEGRRG